MEIIEKILVAFQQTSWLERFAVLCGIIQVILSKNNKVSNYLFGIVGILSGMYLHFGAKLYADMALSMYYLVMSIYGWWYWKNRTKVVEKPISFSTRQEWAIILAISFGGFAFFYFFLTFVTDSDVPIWDAWVSSTAWAGMWLMAKRKIENWILLNISNLFAIPLLIYKELYLFAALTAFLFVIAIFGYIKWREIMYSQNLKPQT